MDALFFFEFAELCREVFFFYLLLLLLFKPVINPLAFKSENISGNTKDFLLISLFFPDSLSYLSIRDLCLFKEVY